LRFDISDAILLPAVLPPRLISWLVNRKTPRASPAREFIAPLRRARCVRARSGGKINDFISRARHRRAKRSSVASELRAHARCCRSPIAAFTRIAGSMFHELRYSSPDNTRAVCLRDASPVECGIEARQFEFRICAIAQWRFDKAQQDHRRYQRILRKRRYLCLSFCIRVKNRDSARFSCDPRE